MSLMKIKLFFNKSKIFLKKYWWLSILALALVVASFIYFTTRNGAYVAMILDMFEKKKDQHDQELETLNHIHNTEIQEKNLKLAEHNKRLQELEEEFKSKNLELDKKKKQVLKELVDDNYHNPDVLSRKIAEEFGLEHG
jgi:septal ring factor EnvC (AmiA/AmiB activator)